LRRADTPFPTDGCAKWIVDCPAEPIVLRIVYDDDQDLAVERVIVPRADQREAVRVVLPQ